MFTNRRVWIIVQVLVAVFLMVGCDRNHSDTEEGDAAHHEDEGAEVAAKTDFDNYSAAVAAIDEHRAHVAELIEKNELENVHSAAKPIQEIAEKLNALALKEDSGVPRESLKEVNLASKALAKTWARIDEAGDEGDLAGTKLVYEEMVELIDELKVHANAEAEEHHEESGQEESGHEESGHDD